MPNPSSITSFLLILCSLSLSLAFSPTLKASYFYMDQPNYLSFELDQTRNGIIGFSIEAANSSYRSSQTVSQYVLLDIPNRDAKVILTDLVSACEDLTVTPTFQNLHYHAKTDTLAYFCYANNSLLLIDQSSYTVEQVIPFNISGAWPVAKLSTEGMGIAILLMGDLLTTTSKASLLVKVDLQARAVTAEIYLNQGFGVAEAVVAYASGKKGAYIATNRIQGKNLATTIYSINIIGKTYQITPLTSFSAPIPSVKIITKLFCLGNYIVTNNGQNLYFINQEGDISTQVRVDFRISNPKSTYFYNLAATAQSESTYLFLRTDVGDVYKYSVLADGIHSKKLGGFPDMKIAYGNSISGDLMLTIDVNAVNFTIFDIKTMKQVYFAPAGFTDHMLTDTTYAVRYFDTYIFDLESNDLIATPRAPESIYYTKEQNIISQWLGGPTNDCSLQHIDLITGKAWITVNTTAPYSCGDLDKLRLTENGNPEYIMHESFSDYSIATETYGQLGFKAGDVNIHRGLNFDFDNLSFYVLNSSTTLNQTNITSYAFNTKSKKFEYRDSNLLSNVSGESFAYVNATQSIIINDNTVVIINGIGRNPEKHSFSQDWNSASSFQDPAGNNYVILTKYDASSLEGSVPGLLVNGIITNLPGTRKESARAQAAGVNSYWIADRLHQSIGAVRVYKVDNSKRAEERISI